MWCVPGGFWKASVTVVQSYSTTCFAEKNHAVFPSLCLDFAVFKVFGAETQHLVHDWRRQMINSFSQELQPNFLNLWGEKSVLTSSVEVG